MRTPRASKKYTVILYEDQFIEIKKILKKNNFGGNVSGYLRFLIDEEIKHSKANEK